MRSEVRIETLGARDCWSCSCKLILRHKVILYWEVVLSQITHAHDEETTMNKSSLFLLIVCTLLASSAAAQINVTVHTTNARYGTTCQGFVSTAPVRPSRHSHCWELVPAMRMVFKCTGTQSFDGTVVPASMKGSSIVTLTAPARSPTTRVRQGTGHQLPHLHDGKELRGMLQNAGTASSAISQDGRPEITTMNRLVPGGPALALIFLLEGQGRPPPFSNPPNLV